MHEFKKYSPILIPTLNRFTHFKRCVESLIRCKYADKTDLFIALDYPLKESHWEGYNKIIEYLNDINGFNTINIIKRDINFGVILNIEKARESIFEKYDTLFFSEDDNEFSPNTLEYINLGLEKFEKDESIYAICASHHQIEIPNSTTGTYFTLDSFSPMGYATWKNKFLKYLLLDKEKYIVNFLNDYSNYNLFKKERLYLIASMLESISKKYILGDGVLTAYLLNNNMKCVFPIIHKVRNHGHDGSGVNSGNIKGISPYAVRIIDLNNDFEFIEEKNIAILKQIRIDILNNLREPFLKRIFIKVRYYLFYFFGFTFSSKLFKNVYNKYIGK